MRPNQLRTLWKSGGAAVNGSGAAYGSGAASAPPVRPAGSDFGVA